MKWKVSRTLGGNKKQGEYFIHAPTIEAACKLEGHTMTEVEKDICTSESRMTGRPCGNCFIQNFEEALPENKRHYVWISPTEKG